MPDIGWETQYVTTFYMNQTQISKGLRGHGIFIRDIQIVLATKPNYLELWFT